MKYDWLHRTGNSKLLLFFCGWGNDSSPFEPLVAKEYDVLCLHSYHNPQSCPVGEIMESYGSVYVVAWSMGVLQAEQVLAGTGAQIEKALAVNGTLFPVSDDYGIPRRAYMLTVRSFSEAARNSFFLRMCGSRSTFARYSEHLPQRDVGEQKDELVFHQNQSAQFGQEHTRLFTHVLLGREDQIFPFENMQRFWSGFANVRVEPWPHFVFYQFDTWDDLLGSCC